MTVLLEYLDLVHLRVLAAYIAFSTNPLLIPWRDVYKVGLCDSFNTGMRALPDMYARLPEGCRPEGRGHTYQVKPEYPVLQLICNIY